jgi:hypothetical protein
MFITFKELFEIDEMKSAKVIAGKNGLHHVIIWYVVSETADQGHENYEDKLVFVGGLIVREAEKALLEIIESLIHNGAVGVVLEVGEYIKEVPESVIKKGDEHDFVVIHLPFAVSIEQVTYKMARQIFANTVKQDGMSEVVGMLMNEGFSEELYQKFIYYGYNPKMLYCAAVVKPDDFFVNKAYDKLLYKVLYCFVSAINRMGDGNVFVAFNENALVFLFEVRELTGFKNEIRALMDRVRQGRGFATRQLSVSMGIGSVFSNAALMAKSIGEAYKTYNLIKKCGKSDEVRIYEDIGVYQLFYELGDNAELLNIYHDVLGILIEYDRENRSFLLKTLETYLDCGCNIGLTSHDMDVHRNTVKYRIQRIQEIMKLDFSDAERCFQLRFAYKIKKHLEIES